MTIYRVSVSATDLPRAQAFYGLLGFRFPGADPEHSHLEAEDDSGVRLLVESASSLAGLYGTPPRPGTTSPGSPTTRPTTRPGPHRYARVADPDGYEVVVFCPLRP